MSAIFGELQGSIPEISNKTGYVATGDVKYHLGTTFTRELKSGKTLETTVLANPSHLETVDPVVMGRVRCEQHFMKDTKRTKVAPIIIHGDASFAGQGICYEAIQMQSL